MRRITFSLFCLLPLVAIAQIIPTKITLPCESGWQVLSPTGEHIAIGCKDHSVYVLALPSGKTEHQLSSTRSRMSCTFSQDGKWFAAGLTDGSVDLMPTAGVAAPRTWKATTAAIDEVEFLPDGKTLVVSPHEQAGQVWRLDSTPKLVAKLASDFSGLSFVVPSPDGKMLVTGGADTTVRLYDTASWKLIHDYRKFTLEPFAASFTPDGKYLLVGGADAQFSVFETQTGAEVRKLPASDVIGKIASLGDNQHAVVAQWDADGHKPSYVSLWNINTGAIKRFDTEPKITSVGIVHGSPWFISASGNTLQLWSNDSGSAGK
jgi:WD40 repeat protein